MTFINTLPPINILATNASTGIEREYGKGNDALRLYCFVCSSRAFANYNHIPSEGEINASIDAHINSKTHLLKVAKINNPKKKVN